MAYDPSQTNFANNSAILMTLLSAGALIFSHVAPLQDARPESDEVQFHESATAQTVDARLWQDPFTAVAKAVSDKNTQSPCQADQGQSCALRNQLDIADETRDRSIFVATVSAAPYAEQEETRRRLRYALVSGFDAMGFVPKDAQHIGYAVISCATQPSDGEKSLCEDPGTNLPDRIPFEKFENKSNPNQEIIVLWLDEDVLAGRPLAKLSRLANLIVYPRGDAPAIQVIGPSWSDRLRDLMVEACDVKEPAGGGSAACNPDNKRWSWLKNTIFYAYGATVNDESLFSEIRDKSGKIIGKLCDLSVPKCTVHGFLEKRGIHLLRTIATDDVLSKAIVEELRLRDVVPSQQKHIALISEWDSYYGRTFPQLVQGAIGAQKKASLDDPSHNIHWVHKRTYLHGLDGALPKNLKVNGKKQDASNGGSSESGNSPVGADKDPAKRQLDQKASEKAFGQGQFDYLRRLASDLREENDDLKRSGDGSIAAIGVVGGDVFDKLLVLRALKPEFPQAVFFTDDFDALLSLESELPWTRNLLVASSYGPKLSPDLQKDLPPFRDVLQTSAFLSTQLAVGDIDKLKAQANAPANLPKPVEVSSLALFEGRSADSVVLVVPAVKDEWAEEQEQIANWLQKARIFEVERTGAILSLTEQLPPEEKPEPNIKECALIPRTCSSVHPADPIVFPAIHPFPQYFLGFLFTVAWLGALWRMRSHCAKLKEKRILSYGEKERSNYTFESFVYWSFILLFVFFAIFAAIVISIWLLWPFSARWLTDKGDPMALMQGVSTWPSIYIRAFTLGLAAWLTFIAWRNLDKNLGKIADKLKLDPPERVVSANHCTDIRRFWGERLYNYFSYRLTDKSEDQEKKSYLAKELWVYYVVQGRASARFWRIMAFCIVSFMLAYVLAIIIGMPYHPGRGMLARKIYLILAYLDFFSLLFLMFFVVDATFLCYSFVRHLSKRETEWPEDTRNAFVEKLGLDQNALPAGGCHTALDDWIDVDFIATRTRCISNLIYYPFIIIALIIFCHSSLFGNFSWNRPLVVIMGLSVAIVVGCAILLNLVAEDARRMAEKHLLDEVIKTERASGDGQARQWDRLLDRVRNLREGSFRPFLQQPFVGAIMLPLGSIGWTTLFEQGHLFGL